MTSPTTSGITSWTQLRNEATESQEITTGNSTSQKSPSEWEHVSEGPWSRRRKHQSVVWGTNLLLLGGFDGEAAFDLNDVWSYDGQSWQMVTDHAGWSGRDGHCAVVFKGSIFVMGGTDDPYNCKCDVWRSDNGGSTWLQICPYAPWPERWQHAACVHDGRIYVIGGWGDRYLNDVWASSDGINWTQECANAPWKPRMFLSVVVFNDAIYVMYVHSIVISSPYAFPPLPLILLLWHVTTFSPCFFLLTYPYQYPLIVRCVSGGHDGRMQLRDAWASCDGGKTWTQVCQAAQWEGRQGHACVTLDGHVYLMGGFGGATRFNDLWRSTDCGMFFCFESLSFVFFLMNPCLLPMYLYQPLLMDPTTLHYITLLYSPLDVNVKKLQLVTTSRSRMSRLPRFYLYIGRVRCFRILQQCISFAYQ